MKPEWYYTQGGQQFGPFTAADLKKFGEEGKIKPDDLVWKEGMANWVAAKAVKGIFAAPAPAPTPAPTVTPMPAGGGPADDFAYEAPGVGGKIKAAPRSERPASNDDQQADDFDDRGEISVRPAGGSKSGGGYLTFNKFIVPVIIQLMFWLGLFLAILVGLGIIGYSVLSLSGMPMILGAVTGFLSIFIYGLGVRIYCELLILSFRIYSTLVEIRDELRIKR